MNTTDISVIYMLNASVWAQVRARVYEPVQNVTERSRNELVGNSDWLRVIESNAHTILRDGLAYDRCQVGLVTDMDGLEPLAEFDVHDRAQMSRELRNQFRA